MTGAAATSGWRKRHAAPRRRDEAADRLGGLNQVCVAGGGAVSAVAEQSAGPGVTESADATFTLTAEPVAHADLAVAVA